jgi:hypothetical protein
MTGRVQFLIESPKITEITLDAKSLTQEILRIREHLPDDLECLIELAEFGLKAQTNIPSLSLPPTTGPLNWSSDLFPADLLSTLRESFEKGDKIAIRIPVTIRDKERKNPSSYFDVIFMRHSKDNDGKPIYIREGLIIPDIRPTRTRGVLSLVIIDEGPLAWLLGDAENPAHTQWQKDGSNFKNKYLYGPSHIRFVVSSIAEIIAVLIESEKKEDRTLLIDFFSLPEEATAQRVEVEKSDSKRGRVSPNKVKRITSGPKKFRVTTIAGGFSVRPGDEKILAPSLFEISAAYDVRRGNALRKYRAADFQIDTAPIVIDAKGVDIKRTKGNTVLVAVRQDDFRVSVTGFDDKRQLYVQVVPREE